MCFTRSPHTALPRSDSVCPSRLHSRCEHRAFRARVLLLDTKGPLQPLPAANNEGEGSRKSDDDGSHVPRHPGPCAGTQTTTGVHREHRKGRRAGYRCGVRTVTPCALPRRRRCVVVEVCRRSSGAASRHHQHVCAPPSVLTPALVGSLWEEGDGRRAGALYATPSSPALLTSPFAGKVGPPAPTALGPSNCCWHRRSHPCGPRGGRGVARRPYPPNPRTPPCPTTQSPPPQRHGQQSSNSTSHPGAPLSRPKHVRTHRGSGCAVARGQ